MKKSPQPIPDIYGSPSPEAQAAHESNLAFVVSEMMPAARKQVAHAPPVDAEPILATGPAGESMSERDRRVQQENALLVATEHEQGVTRKAYGHDQKAGEGAFVPPERRVSPSEQDREFRESIRRDSLMREYSVEIAKAELQPGAVFDHEGHQRRVARDLDANVALIRAEQKTTRTDPDRLNGPDVVGDAQKEHLRQWWLDRTGQPLPVAPERSLARVQFENPRPVPADFIVGEIED